MRYLVTGNIHGLKRGAIVELNTLPRAYVGRVRELPANEVKPEDRFTKVDEAQPKATKRKK